VRPILCLCASRWPSRCGAASASRAASSRKACGARAVISEYLFVGRVSRTETFAAVTECTLLANERAAPTPDSRSPQWLRWQFQVLLGLSRACSNHVGRIFFARAAACCNGRRFCCRFCCKVAPPNSAALLHCRRLRRSAGAAGRCAQAAQRRCLAAASALRSAAPHGVRHGPHSFGETAPRPLSKNRGIRLLSVNPVEEKASRRADARAGVRRKTPPQPPTNDSLAESKGTV